MHKIIKIALIVIGVIAAVLWLFMPDSENPNAINSGSMNFMFILMYLLLGIAVLATLFYGFKKLFSTPGSIKKALFALGGLAIITIIGYAMAGNEQAVVDTMAGRGIETSTGTVKTIGTLLNVFFGMTVVAILLMIWPGIKKLIGR